MRIIFLDIDGVLNGDPHRNGNEEGTTGDYFGYIFQKMVAELNGIISHTNAKIVISSTWRIPTSVEDNQKMIDDIGVVGEVVGFTPRLGRGTVRGNEIALWIKDNEHIIGCKYNNFNQYIIIDDDSDMLLSQASHFIQTDGTVGLTENIAHQARRTLCSFVNYVDIK